MPAQNLYFSVETYKKIISLSEDLNLPMVDTLKELIKQGLLFYKRQFNEILTKEAKELTEKKTG